MQVLNLIDILNYERNWGRIVLFGSPCIFFIFADLLKHELAFDLGMFDNIFLIDVIREVSIEELSSRKNLRKLHIIYFEYLVKSLRETLDDIVLKTVDNVFLGVLLLFVEVDEVLHSV